mmetsp:Transcript_96388/g.300781  ORF Transcript_96388/g.300781 Transcript_96388/m.300781 type:complete len:255 (-) Transcript_96388:315-1079(-)
MILSDAAKVTRKYRHLAYATAGSLLACMFMYVLVRMYVIATQESPPIIAGITNGKTFVGGLPLWGTMPSLVVATERNTWMHSLNSVHATGFYGFTPPPGGFDNIQTRRFKRVMDPSSNYGLDAFFVNLSVVYPKFDDAWGTYFDIDLNFSKDTDYRGMDLFAAPDDWDGNFTHLTRQTQFVFPGEGAFLQNIEVEKRYLPMDGTPFGWPWEGEHTELEAHFRAGTFEHWGGGLRADKAADLDPEVDCGKFAACF